MGTLFSEGGGVVGFFSGGVIDFGSHGFVEHAFVDELVLEEINGVFGAFIFLDFIAGAVFFGVGIRYGMAAVTVGIDFEEGGA